MNLKPFELARCMAGDPVVTRDGRPYKFGAYNSAAAVSYQLVGWLGKEEVACHSVNGHWKEGEDDSNRDLFMVYKPRVMWERRAMLAGGSIISIISSSEDKDTNLDDEQRPFIYGARWLGPAFSFTVEE
jgi:hypothetical protein